MMSFFLLIQWVFFRSPSLPYLLVPVLAFQFFLNGYIFVYNLQSFRLLLRLILVPAKENFFQKKEKNLTLSSSSIEPDFCLPRRKIRNSVPMALHERPGNCFDRSHNVIQDLNSAKEDLLMNGLFENSIEYCSSDHVSVKSEKFYPLRATVHADPFLQQKNASVEKQTFMLRSACSVPVMSIDRTTGSSHLFENVINYSPLAKVYIQSGHPRFSSAYEQQKLHFEKIVSSSENPAFDPASTSGGIFFSQQLFPMQSY